MKNLIALASATLLLAGGASSVHAQAAASAKAAPHYDCSKKGNANKAACKGAATATTSTTPAAAAPAAATAKAAPHYDCTKKGNASKAACKTAAATATTTTTPPAKGPSLLSKITHPAASAAPAAPAPAVAPATPAATPAGHPVCKKGKPCGNSCIAQNKVCHK